ncbi:hypothetical protein SUDANB95_01957 [Actinosynnema sp. ALI-1.44]
MQRLPSTLGRVGDERREFQADLAELEKGIRDEVGPAVEHFAKVLSDVETVEDADPNRMLDDFAVMAAYAQAVGAVLEGQRAAVASLEAFREALEDVVRTYRVVDEAGADSLRALRRD